MEFVKKLMFFLLFAALCVFYIKHWVKNKSYVFNEEDIAKLTRKHVKGGDVEETLKKIARELETSYHGHILPESDRQWVFMYAGGWKGSICLLHASLTEYVLFFGSAVDTVGHSGRYWANISDTLISGQFSQWNEGSLQTKIYLPGDTLVHSWGEVTVISLRAGTWMVEYGRGFIPSTLPFALADAVFSTQDLVHIYKIAVMYCKSLWQELSLNFVQLNDISS